MCTTKGTSCVISVHPIKQSNLTKYRKQGSIQNKIEYFSARRLKCTRNKKRWTDGNVLCNLSAWETFPWRPARPIWVTTNFHVIGVTTMCKRFNRILLKISIIIWTSRNRNCCWVFPACNRKYYFWAKSGSSHVYYVITTPWAAQDTTTAYLLSL